MKRIICALLIFSLSISLVSCVKSIPDTQKPDREISLKIETVNAVYSDELKESASVSLADSTEIIIFKKEKMVLTSEEKQKLTSYIKDKLLPILKDIPVYESELLSLCDFFESFAENFENMNMLSVYTNLVSFLGNERNAALCYELTSLRLAHLRDDYRAKYELTGYAWHLADSEKCQSMLNDLTELLGKEKFAVSFDFSVLCLALTSGILMSENAENQAFTINAPELNMLLRRHSDLLCKKSLSDTEWSVTFEIIEYLSQKELHSAFPVRNAVISALTDNSFLEGISSSANELTALYKSFTLKLNDEQCELLLHGKRAEILRTVCGVLSSCEKELKSFLTSLENASLPDESIGLSELKAIGQGENYGKFLNEYESITSDELISSLREFAVSESDDYTALHRAVISYIYGISPCLAFLVFNEAQNEYTQKGENT